MAEETITTNLPGGTPSIALPGTSIPLPQGSGVEKLVPIVPPFRSNAPPWYTPPGTVWSKMGCAVPQPGRYLQTNNGVIFDFVNMAGRALFDVYWRWDDRKFDRFPSRDCLYEVHQLLVIGRTRLVAKAALPNSSPLIPTKAKPSPQMFVVFPVPFYGPLGCPNQWLHRTGEMVMMMISEAMQHSDNELGFYVTKDFFDVAYGYIKYLLIDLAVKFFGEDPIKAADDKYVIPPEKWATYNPANSSVSFEATSTRPPMGFSPTDLDLEPIRGLPIEQVIGYLQPWPESQLKYSTGGIWSPQGSPGGDTISQAIGGGSAADNPELYKRPGPPTAA
jgi:hypothetical protein